MARDRKGVSAKASNDESSGWSGAARWMTECQISTRRVPFILLLGLALALPLAAACSQPSSTPPAPVWIRLSGSTSMQPLLRDLAAAYSARNPHVSFDFSAVGSGAGLEALRRGDADLALVSRELLPEEEYDTHTGQRIVAYTVIARDGIAVVVSETNPLRQLSLYQVRNIFDGAVISWEELGGPAVDIIVVSREDGSGTRVVFEQSVMYGRSMTSTALIMPGSEAVRDYVATHEGAIGYLSMGYLEPGIAAVELDGVQLQRQSVEDGSYLIARPFLLVSRPEPEAGTTAFMQFARSPAGQAIVQRMYGSARMGAGR
jgi:phosphate transport system substrate-binding protein